jgi:hypothetical protein
VGQVTTLSQQLHEAAGTSLSKSMEVWLKGLFEGGGPSGSKPIPKKTFTALSTRGYVEGGKEISVIYSGADGMVTATLTQKGRDLAIELFKKEHEERLRNNERSERIPALLKQRGVPGF